MKLVISFLIGLMILMTGCSDAMIASHNLSKAADNFEILRRIVFYNGITGDYILTIEGRCSFEDGSGKEVASNNVSVTCKQGDKKFVKHTLGLSDNVTYVSEQVKAESVSQYHYRVIFKPQTILPNIDFKGGM